MAPRVESVHGSLLPRVTDLSPSARDVRIYDYNEVMWFGDNLINVLIGDGFRSVRTVRLKLDTTITQSTFVNPALFVTRHTYNHVTMIFNHAVISSRKQLKSQTRRQHRNCHHLNVRA